VTAGIQVLDRISLYRAAARTLLRNDGIDHERRVAALVAMYDRAKAEPSADLVIGAMVAEVLFNIFRSDAVAVRPKADAFERAQRRVRGRGRDACPTCLSRLLTDGELAELAQLREAEISELRALEGAV